jgi:hypothetical protein
MTSYRCERQQLLSVHLSVLSHTFSKAMARSVFLLLACIQICLRLQDSTCWCNRRHEPQLR